MTRPIPPGSVIGVLGSGQLGRMFAIAARRMGYRVHTFSSKKDTPTGQVSDIETLGSFDDLDAVAEFARSVDVITLEFENIPTNAVQVAERHAPVRPGMQALHTTQHRLREKTFLSGRGFPVAPFYRVNSLNDFEEALRNLNGKGVLKTAGFGYDGKGQRLVEDSYGAPDAFASLSGEEGVLEEFVSFVKEVSVVAARGLDGEFCHFGVIENQHRNHILDVSLSPARVTEAVRGQAVDMARAVLQELEVVGVMCVEFFLCDNESLLINELAPRPHNSGHFSFDACVTSQFEQQLRAVCGLPLGSTEQLRPAAMANLLGEIWNGGEPDWTRACARPQVKLHLYGKAEPRPGRKMGHLTAMDGSVEAAAQAALAARNALCPGSTQQN